MSVQAALLVRLLWLLVALLPVRTVGAEAAGASPMARPQLGANLAPVSDYSQTPVFVDLMEQARRFGTPEAPWDEKALLGADGWPVGDFGVVPRVAMR